jgi:thiamine-phosphate pyrophosphorylase
LGFIGIDAECLAQAWMRQSQRLGAFDAALWPGDPQDFGVQARAERAGFPACPQRLGLYAVLPDAAWVGRMARAGVPTVQLRFKNADPAAITREVRAAVAAVQGTRCCSSTTTGATPSPRAPTACIWARKTWTRWRRRNWRSCAPRACAWA